MDVLFSASCADFLCFTLSLGLQAGGKVLFLGIVFTGMPMTGMDFGSDSLEVSVGGQGIFM